MAGRTLAFIYSRFDSRRLPGKALLPLGDSTVIDVVFDRARKLPVDDCVLLTTARDVDDVLASYVASRGMPVFRGDTQNVVRRTVQAIAALGAAKFIRVNGDSPLFEPELARDAFFELSGETVLVSNLFRRRFPYGVAVEWIDAAFYKDIAQLAQEHESEHVTQHLYRLNHLGRAVSFEAARDDSQYRLVVDTPEDYVRIRELTSGADLKSDPYWRLLGLQAPVTRFSAPSNG